MADLDNFIQRRIQDLMAERNVDVEPLKGGGGDGTSGGMEARVAVLETHMETVRKDVSDLKKDMGDVKVQLATLTERVAHLPGKGFIVTASLSIMAVVAAVAAFQGQIQQLLHLAPVK